MIYVTLLMASAFSVTGVEKCESGNEQLRFRLLCDCSEVRRSRAATYPTVLYSVWYGQRSRRNVLLLLLNILYDL
jgi:hypothetical protein